MDGLDDFMAFNFCEDQREEQESIERASTTEYPYQKRFWDDDSSSKSSYWDDDSSDNNDNY